jgi:hypothetical protein
MRLTWSLLMCRKRHAGANGPGGNQPPLGGQQVVTGPADGEVQGLSVGSLPQSFLVPQVPVEAIRAAGNIIAESETSIVMEAEVFNERAVVKVVHTFQEACSEAAAYQVRSHRQRTNSRVLAKYCVVSSACCPCPACK